ncbi:MAG: YihY family inner membrane protein [Deltaproteobacteria bacterium]|nr:YihY family inner membrane protein [Deltaproteobacteria bacterium]
MGDRSGNRAGASLTRRVRGRAEDLWERHQEGRAGRTLTFWGVALWKFQEDRGFLRASALTYATLLSLVPLMALTFSVLKGLGVQRRLEPLLLERLAAGNEEIMTRILEYVDRTQVASLGALGLVGLIATAVSVLGNIELSFNDIWQIEQGRNLIRKITDYVALLVVGPVLLLASLSLTTTLNSPGVIDRVAVLGPLLRLALRALPYLATTVAFTGAYLILPNRRVPFASALLGGACAGVLWQVAEWSYIRFQFGMARYNAIYGALAQLPVLLVWLYASWCVVLLGAELACVHELPGQRRRLGRRASLWVPQPSVALEALLEVARRYELGTPAPTERELAAALGLSPAEGRELVDRLLEGDLLVATCDEAPRLVPGRAPGRTPAVELLAAVAGGGAAAPELRARLERAVDRELAGLTWADLAVEPRP